MSCSRTQRSDSGEARTRTPRTRVKQYTTEPLRSHIFLLIHMYLQKCMISNPLKSNGFALISRTSPFPILVMFFFFLVGGGGGWVVLLSNFNRTFFKQTVKIMNRRLALFPHVPQKDARLLYGFRSFVKK